MICLSLHFIALSTLFYAVTNFYHRRPRIATHQVEHNSLSIELSTIPGNKLNFPVHKTTTTTVDVGWRHCRHILALGCLLALDELCRMPFWMNGGDAELMRCCYHHPDAAL